MKNFRLIFNKCLEAIGGKKNDDIKWYLYDRDKIISRDTFFGNVVWAVWVSGMRRKSTETFLKNAENALAAPVSLHTTSAL